MAFKDWFFKPTPLQSAIKRGLAPEGDLTEELRAVGDEELKSASDAHAVIAALKHLLEGDLSKKRRKAAHSLIALFQNVPGRDCEAFDVMADEGTSLLVRIVDSALQDNKSFDTGDVLFAMKVLAMYGTSEGTDAVIRAAKAPLDPSQYMWSVVLRNYSAKHPHCERLLRALSEPLPSDFLAVSLMDCANAALLENAGLPHPFNSRQGLQRIEAWLKDSDSDHFSYATSATAALPFITVPDRDRLLALALDHQSPGAQMEAAWAAAKLGRDAGLKYLVRLCSDVNQSDTAKRYLADLGREDLIPNDAADPDFRAKAEFAKWLAHPSELGQPPDELDIVDQRDLTWPIDGERKPFWLIRYVVRDTTGLEDDDVGIGLIGSVTFCLFSYDLERRPPEDVYAIYCVWEMEHAKLISEEEVEESTGEYDTLLRQWEGGPLTNPRILRVAELSQKVEYPQRLVGLAGAQLDGEDGWVVLDGNRSRWYATADFPDDRFNKLVLNIHIGRQLLGFSEMPDRKKYLNIKAQKRSPRQIVDAYERHLNAARTDSTQTEKLLGAYSILGKKFDDYVSALATESSDTRDKCTTLAYDKLLAAVSGVDQPLQGELLDSDTALGENFNSYVDALIRLSREREIPALIERMSQGCKHILGYRMLGRAAFRAGHHAIAEPFFLKVRQGMEEWHSCKEMSDLAEIWHRRGELEPAHLLLIDAMHGVVQKGRECKGGDRKTYDEYLQVHRNCYLRLFPERGDAQLHQLGIPKSIVV